MRFGLSAVEKRDVWSRWKAGQTLHEIGRVFDKPHSCSRVCHPSEFDWWTFRPILARAPYFQPLTNSPIVI
jgi:hypothetical protein